MIFTTPIPIPIPIHKLHNSSIVRVAAGGEDASSHIFGAREWHRCQCHFCHMELFDIYKCRYILGNKDIDIKSDIGAIANATCTNKFTTNILATESVEPRFAAQTPILEPPAPIYPPAIYQQVNQLNWYDNQYFQQKYQCQWHLTFHHQNTVSNLLTSRFPSALKTYSATVLHPSKDGIFYPMCPWATNIGPKCNF